MDKHSPDTIMFRDMMDDAYHLKLTWPRLLKGLRFDVAANVPFKSPYADTGTVSKSPNVC